MHTTNTVNQNPLNVAKILKNTVVLLWNNIFRLVGVSFLLLLFFAVTLLGITGLIKITSLCLSRIGINILEDGGNAFFYAYTQGPKVLEQSQTPEVLIFEILLISGFLISFSLVTNLGARYVLAIHDYEPLSWKEIKNVLRKFVPLTALDALYFATRATLTVTLAHLTIMLPVITQTLLYHMASILFIFLGTYLGFAFFFIVDQKIRFASALKKSVLLVVKNSTQLFILSCTLYVITLTPSLITTLVTKPYGPSKTLALFLLFLGIIVTLFTIMANICAYRQCIPANDKPPAL